MKRIHSFSELGKALRDANLSKGLLYCDQGEYAQAVTVFDSIKDLTSLEYSIKLKIKLSYYTCGKYLQHQEQLAEARRCLTRARETDYNDIHLLERKRLLDSHHSYKTIENIGKFRVAFGEGFTSAKFEKYPLPFLEIAEKIGLLQESKEPAKSNLIDKFYTIGVYRTPYQGRHFLSKKIRDYKYHGNAELALPFAWLLADYIKGRTQLLKSVDIVVPLPSNPNKQSDRGFAPCFLIGKEMSKCLAIPYKELFLVAPMGRRFREISYQEGKELIRYKDSQCHKMTSDKVVLLLDDVVTTGRTLNLFADILRDAGAKKVYAITLAKTGAPV